MSFVAMLFFALFPHIAKAQLTPGVLQSAAQTAIITGTVVQSDGAPVAGADVLLTGPARLATKSDALGTFVFTSVPYGTYGIVVNKVGLGTATRNTIIVKDDMNVAIQYERPTPGGLKEIARVSTQNVGSSINVTSANVASVSPSDYAFQGNTSWKELLNQIPGVTVGGDLGAGRGLTNVVPDGPLQAIVLSINGALPYETSTTLDGMPLESGAEAGPSGNGFNLAYLPLTTFDTADVVRGPGANAPSIVDSIGGSFVLHAPGRIDKNQFEFSISNDPYGGLVTNAKAAVHFGRLSASFFYGTNNSPGPIGNTRVIPSCDQTYSALINGNLVSGGGTTGVYRNPKYNGGAFDFDNSLLYCCVPVSSAWTQHNGAVALSYDITPSINTQIFYAGTSSVMQLPDPISASTFVPAPGYTGSIAPGTYTSITASGPTTETVASSLLEEKLTAYIGHGVLRLAALQNNSFEQQTQRYSSPNGQYRLYGTVYYNSAPNTPVNFNGTSAFIMFAPCSVNDDQWTNNRDFLASYAMQVGSESNVGISYVTSYYNSPYWIAQFFGGSSYPGSQPTADSETTNEVRIHAGTEVSDKLSLDASWYFARGSYHLQNPNDPTGNTYVDSVLPYSAPRIGGVWRVNNNAAIRAAAGGGYALPPLNNLVGTNGAPSCYAGICNVTLENLNLQPEKAFSWDLGSDLRLHHDTVLSFDLYRTNLYGQFFSSVTLSGTCPTCSGLPLYVTQYNNLQQSRYEGINFDVHHDVARGMYWHVALGLTRAYVVSVPAGFYNASGQTCNISTGAGCMNTYIVPGMNFDGEYQSTVPYANGAAQIGYRWSPGKYIDISPTYYGNNNPYFEPAFLEFDAHAGYQLTKNISLLATFRNIAGIYGQNYEYYTLFPAVGAPTVAGLPYSLIGLPYGPRSMIVTVNFK